MMIQTVRCSHDYAMIDAGGDNVQGTLQIDVVVIGTAPACFMSPKMELML